MATGNVYYIFQIGLFIVMSGTAFGFDNHLCSYFGGWQTQCDDPGKPACDVSYESEAYCIAICNSSRCTKAIYAAHTFKEIICNTRGYAADFIKVGNNTVGLAIHRNRRSDCSTYQNKTFGFIPRKQLYPEGPAGTWS